jgi:putative transposase
MQKVERIQDRDYTGTMKKLQAFKFELMPNGAQRRTMHQFAGMCRFVYNKALETHQARRAAGEKFASHFDACKWLPGWKAQFPWLKKAHSQILQVALKDVHQAHKNLFEKRAGFPKFKKKGNKESFCFPQGCKLAEQNATIYLPKIGVVRYIKSREVVGTIKNVTCSCKAGRWFVSIQTELEVENPLPKATSAIGIDLGVTNFATLSDGTFIKPLNSFKKHEQRLKRHQRRMSRKVKGSHNYKKAKRKLQKVHATLTNARQDFLHKTSRQIVDNHAMIVVEDLKVKNMTAKGNHKRGLNKSILDQGWFEFKRQLAYKSAWNGTLFVEVPAAYTSQTCNHCGHVHKDNRQTQSNFTCVACGHHEHADVNAAKNILARGHRVFACGGSIRQPKPRASVAGPTKQEPDEEILDLAVEDSVGIPAL